MRLFRSPRGPITFDLAKSRSHVIWIYQFDIALTFGLCLHNNAEVSHVKFRSDINVLKYNLKMSNLRQRYGHSASWNWIVTFDPGNCSYWQHSCQHEPSNCFIARLEAGLNARLDTARHGQNMRFGVMDGTMTWEIIYYVFLCDCVVISSTWILLNVSLNLMSMLSPAVSGSRHLVSTLDIFKSLEFIQKSLMVQKHSWCQDFWTWTCSYETLGKIHW